MLTSSRSPQDHLLSSALGAFMGDKSLQNIAQTAVISYSAIAASNAVANKDYSKAILIASAGWGINKILGDNMNPYLNNCPNCGWKNQNAKTPNNWAPEAQQSKNWANSQMQNNGSFLSSPMFKGMLIGAAVAYLLSNKEAKDSIIKGVAKLQNFAASAVEEFKEQIEDAKASLQD